MQSLLLNIFIALCVIMVVLMATRKLAALMGQPKVVGEMLAGILLGPTLLGFVAPNLQNALFSSAVLDHLSILSNIGLTFYMFLVGMEFDQTKLQNGGLKQASRLIVLGFVPSFLLGAGTVFALGQFGVLPGGYSGKLMIFMGLTMSITALPVVARILQEKKVLRTRTGSLALLVAGADDVIAWMILAFLLSAVQSSDMMSGLYTFVGTLLFTAIMLLVVKPLLNKLADKVKRVGKLQSESFALIVLLVLLAASVTDFLGVHTVFGAFILGLIMPRGEVIMQQVKIRLEHFMLVLLMPIFFVVSGLQTNLLTMASDPSLLVPLATITIVAFLAKYGFCTLAIRQMGYSWQESSAIGGLLNARGVMGLVIANIGLTTGILNLQLFTLLIAMVIITTACAVPIYNWSMRDRGELRYSTRHEGAGRA